MKLRSNCDGVDIGDQPNVSGLETFPAPDHDFAEKGGMCNPPGSAAAFQHHPKSRRAPRNPHWYQHSKDKITVLQQAVSRKKRGSHRRKQAVRRLAKARAYQARKRLDFLHQKTCQLARENALVAMEDLAIKNMTRSAKGTVDKPGKKVAQKAGLNREILDTAPALLMQLLSYKVTDTGGMWAEAPKRKLKPSQTCPECGQVRKKILSERTHRCDACGHTEPRDIASARVVLNWALYGTPTAPQSRQELTAAGFAPCETPSNRSATWLE